MTKPPFVAVALLTAAASFALWQPAAAQGDAVRLQKREQGGNHQPAKRE